MLTKLLLPRNCIEISANQWLSKPKSLFNVISIYTCASDYCILLPWNAQFQCTNSVYISVFGQCADSFACYQLIIIIFKGQQVIFFYESSKIHCAYSQLCSIWAFYCMMQSASLGSFLTISKLFIGNESGFWTSNSSVKRKSEEKNLLNPKQDSLATFRFNVKGVRVLVRKDTNRFLSKNFFREVTWKSSWKTSAEFFFKIYT